MKNQCKSSAKYVIKHTFGASNCNYFTNINTNGRFCPSIKCLLTFYNNHSAYSIYSAKSGYDCVLCGLLSAGEGGEVDHVDFLVGKIAADKVARFELQAVGQTL